jgi:hypothetical protein
VWGGGVLAEWWEAPDTLDCSCIKYLYPEHQSTPRLLSLLLLPLVINGAGLAENDQQGAYYS